MAPPPILLVDPADVLMQPIAQAGYPVTRVSTAAAAREHLPRAALVVTELDLPDQDGLVLIAELHWRLQVPIVACTTRGPRDRILALKIGADAVIEKPVDPAELVGRINAVIRRAHYALPGATLLRCGRLVINLAGATARLNGKPVHLTATEFRLLAVLAQSYGDVVPHATLIEQVLARTADVNAIQTLRVHLNRVRKALHCESTESFVRNIRGAGYLLLDPNPDS